MKTLVTRLVGLAALAASLMWPTHSQAQCITGDFSAEFQTQGEHAGLWKYCMEFQYASDGPLDEIIVDFWYFKICGEGVGCGDYWTFDPVAGRAFGANGCTLDLTGRIDCQGDDLLGSPGPLLRFRALPAEKCNPDYVGKGSFCFYTQFGPMGGEDSMAAGQPLGDTMAIYARSGDNLCVGFFNGPRPSACVTPTAPRTWGSIKSQYR